MMFNLSDSDAKKLNDSELHMALDGQVDYQIRRREQLVHGQVQRAVFASNRILVDGKGPGCLWWSSAEHPPCF